MDDDAKLKLRMALIWHSTLAMKAMGPANTTAGLGKKMANSASAYGRPAKHGIKTCKAFNDNHCFKGHEHPQYGSMCALSVVRLLIGNTPTVKIHAI